MSNPLIWRCNHCGHITPRHPETSTEVMTECVKRYDFGCQGIYEPDSLMQQDIGRLDTGATV